MEECVRRIRPTEVASYLGNPHQGCCTFQRFNGDELFPGTMWSEEGPLDFPVPKQFPCIDGYLPSTVAYCRWFWKLMEPERSRYDFSMIDRALETCAQRGQRLAVRMMAFGNARQPQVPEWYASRYPMEVRRHKSTEIRVPVHDAPEYLEHWGGFVREFAKRYDPHPLLETIDVAFIGPWGEGAGECSREQCARFARLWGEAFERTPRLALIGGHQMRESVRLGSGWRCDCFGDLKAPGSPHVRKDLSWNHHFEAYPREVLECGAREAWRHAPVHFETCGVPMDWYRQGYDLDFIIRQGLKFHGTYFMPKSSRLPEPWLEKLRAFCRRLGYRFVYRHFSAPRSVRAGGALRFQSWIENVGVAPLYRRYSFALRLRQGDREFLVPQEDVDIRSWLPGDVWLDRELRLPEGIKPGWVDLAAGLIDLESGAVRVKFAVKEQFGDGWVDLNGFEVSG